jgi:hypothetical protein
MNRSKKIVKNRKNRRFFEKQASWRGKTSEINRKRPQIYVNEAMSGEQAHENRKMAEKCSKNAKNRSKTP